jgi:AraC-like DNA-binding protein
MESIEQKAMSIYMDRHNVSESITAEHVAQLHQEDLKVQHRFNCTGLTYWFDDKRKMAFCLVEAPNKQAVHDMHNNSHGDVPHNIIEVDVNLVESFLGRIEDPRKGENTELNIINDPAFRTIMAVELQKFSITDDHLFQNVNESIVSIIQIFNGRIVKQRDNYYLGSFESVSKAVSCALEVRSSFYKIIKENDKNNLKLKIGLSSGIPVTEKSSIFEDTIKLAERMCTIAEAEIVVSSEVKDLYKSENLNVFIHGKKVFTLTPSDEKFLTLLMDYTDETWKNTDLKVDDFSKQLGYSKSQLYRKMITLINKSPNTFIKEYRLTQALKLLNEQKGNISEIAFETGFNSLSYFSKCFQKRYNLLPSDYLSTNVL